MISWSFFWFQFRNFFLLSVAPKTESTKQPLEQPEQTANWLLWFGNGLCVWWGLLVLVREVWVLGCKTIEWDDGIGGVCLRVCVLVLHSCLVWQRAAFSLFLKRLLRIPDLFLWVSIKHFQICSTFILQSYSRFILSHLYCFLLPHFHTCTLSLFPLHLFPSTLYILILHIRIFPTLLCFF